jgi:hypothetical protein
VGVILGLALASYLCHRYVKKRTAEKYEKLREEKEHSTEMTAVQGE